MPDDEPTPVEDMTPVQMLAEIQSLRERMNDMMILNQQNIIMRRLLLQMGIFISFSEEETQAYQAYIEEQRQQYESEQGGTEFNA